MIPNMTSCFYLPNGAMSGHIILYDIHMQNIVQIQAYIVP